MSKYYLFILSFIILFTGYAFAEGEGTVKVGLDMSGKHKISGEGLSGTEDVSTGFSFSGEYSPIINESFKAGIGISYQVPRAQEDYDGDFNFIPIYGLIKINPTAPGVIAPYVIAQIGHNFFNGDEEYKEDFSLNGGLYYGLGAGLIFEQGLQIELLYSVNNGSADILDYDFNIDYSHIGISFGYTTPF